MYENLKGKKLLIIGADMNDLEIVRTAQSMGIYAIALDWSTDYDESPAKKIADEAWDMNYRDIEAVSKRCKEKSVDGVMAGYSEMRVLLAAQISVVIGKPFYVTEEIMEMTRDKRRFKELCIKYGVPVPHEFCASGKPTENELAKVRFPVIVKPSDYGGRIGITICENACQLDSAIQKALSVSEKKEVVVEEYITGAEMCAVYNLSDGEIELALLNDKYQVIVNNSRTVLCNATVVPSVHLDEFLEKADQPIKRFLRGIGAQNGMAFFQMIVNKDGIYIFEMGYRLNGGNDCHVIEQYNHINHMKMMISHSLTGSMGDDIKKNNPRFEGITVTFLFYVHGGKVGEIEYSRLNYIPEVFSITQKIFPGTVVIEDGTTRQEALVIKLHSADMEGAIKTIQKAQKYVSINDIDGKSMLFEPFDTNRLRIGKW